MTWDTTTPPDNEAISNGANRIRQLEIDLQTAFQAEGAFPINPSSPILRPRGGKDILTNRPSAVNGGLFFNTDSGILQRSTGAAWEDVGSMGSAYGVSAQTTGTFLTTSASYVDITDVGAVSLSVTIVTVGRPVLLHLVPGLTVSLSYVGVIKSDATSSGIISARFRFLRDGSALPGGDRAFNVQHNYIVDTSTAHSIQIPPAAISLIDVPAAGSHTYKVQGLASGAGSQLVATGVSIVAAEL